MRALTAGAPATLFKINLDIGHGGASGRYDYLREIAFDYAWVLGASGGLTGPPGRVSEAAGHRSALTDHPSQG